MYECRSGLLRTSSYGLVSIVFGNVGEKMIDTLMVVWTTGLWKQLLRSTGTFLLLFGCICLLSFLITTSSGKWSRLAASTTQAGSFVQPASSPQTGVSTGGATTLAPATVQPAPAPTAHPTVAPYIVPIILQNPLPPENTDIVQERSHHHTSTYTPPDYTPQRPAVSATKPPDFGSSDLSNVLQNLP